MTYIHEIPRWLVFSLISSILCIFGALCVPLMSTIFKSNAQGHSSNNTKLVNYGLSLSAGSMLTTSLYMMLPKMNRNNKAEVFFGVLTGVCISIVLNYVVHVYASESLVHCAHGDGEREASESGHRETYSGTHNHYHYSHENNHECGYYSTNNHDSNNNNPSHQVNVNYKIQYPESHPIDGNKSSDMNEYIESDPLLPNINTGVKENTSDGNTNPDNKNTTVTLSKKKSTAISKSLIDLLTGHHRNSVGDCFPLGECSECTPTLETNELPCSKTAVVSQNNISPMISHRSSNINFHSNYLDHIDPNNLDSTKKIQQGIACAENVIGYDLENLSLYRKNFYSATTDKDESNINFNNTKSNNDDATNSNTHRYEFTSESPSSANVSNSIESHEERSVHILPNANEHHHNYHSISTGSNDNNEYDLENHISHIESYPHSTHFIRHHSLQTSHIHHHHIETPFSKLLSIGMQTCIVLTLHKFPEGFIIFYTNKDDTPDSLGFSIFLSLTIHNFVEGFAMTLPLYAIFETKWLAVLITAILGGGSQPMGALLGYLIFGHKRDSSENELQMDLFLSITAGFLLFIGLQMFQTGVGFSDTHHHHQGEGNEEMKMNHSSGTTCLKWCCVGVLLILASQAFE